MRKALLLLSLLLLTVTWASVGAQEGTRLVITGRDVSEFPLVKLDVIAAGQNSRRLAGLSGMTVTEDGVAVAVEDVDEIIKGVQVFFVIDANRTINTRDVAGGPTRREVVRDSIIRYAEAYMNQSQLDRVSIIVPEGDQPAVLLPYASFSTEVINEVNFYEPGSVGDTPLNEMLLLAISQAAEQQAEGRFQALVLFTDGASIDQQVDFPAVVESAQSVGLPIFVALLGARADPAEIENAIGLYEPTQGNYEHVPLPEAADSIFDRISEHSVQSQIIYRSQLNTPEPHQVSVEFQGAQASTEIVVEVSPAEAAILLEPGQTIRRVVASPDAPVAEAEPTSQTVPVQVLWPDGYPREVTNARLLINGTAQASIEGPSLDDSGSFTIDWDVSQLGDGDYELVVEVDDELGLTGSSEPVPLGIAVEGLVVEEESVPVVVPTAAPVQAEESTNLLDSIGLLGIVVGILAIIVAIVLIVVAVMLMQQRRQGPAEVVVTQPQVDQGAVDQTQILRPAFAAGQTSGAFLEAVENAPEHSASIEVPPEGVTLGRDPRVARVVFKDKSVSRLHARISATGGVYQLFDEGSASGTYVNYEQVGLTPQNLRDGDDVHIGRVHLRFHVAAGADDADSTQIMPAPKPPEKPQTEDDGLSTQPYMPNQPQTPPAQRPAAQPGPAADDDEDDISTEPFMPHTPRR